MELVTGTSKFALSKPTKLSQIATSIKDTMKHSNLLFIGDLHCPYEHPDTFDFLAALRAWIRATWVGSVGDETDIHHVQWHQAHPQALGPQCEYEAAKAKLDRLEKLFPRLKIANSNHGNRYSRIAKAAMLPKDVVRTLPEIWDKPNWEWAPVHVVELADGQRVTMTHGDKFKHTPGMPHGSVQGHRHTEGGVIWHRCATGETSWRANTGCLIDPTAPAFDYTPKHPVLGSVIIQDCIPQFIPMLLDKHGRWSGKF